MGIRFWLGAEFMEVYYIFWDKFNRDLKRGLVHWYMLFRSAARRPSLVNGTLNGAS
jgi:hypothetical protein